MGSQVQDSPLNPAEERPEHAAVSFDVLAAGLAHSWRRHRLLLLGVWTAVAVACGLAVASSGLHLFVDFREPGSGRWAGLMTVFSAFCFAMSGFALLVIARRALRRWGRSLPTIAWVMGGLGSVVLALDEIAQVHESAARRLAAWGVPEPFGIGDQDLYVFALYGLTALFVLFGTWPQLARWRETWLPGAVALGCFAVSGLADTLPWEQMTAAQRGLWGPIEETSKTLGSANLAVFGLLLLEASSGDEARSELQPGDGRD